MANLSKETIVLYKEQSKTLLHSWDNVKLAHRICNSIKSDNLVK